MQQAIPHPSGVTVFGSYLIKLDPDRALLTFRVSKTSKTARDAFAAAREAAAATRDVLEPHRKAGADVRTSSITLNTLYDRYKKGAKVTGQCAVIRFSVALPSVDSVELVLTEVVDAGADIIDSVELHTSGMKEARARARRGAFEAAQAKAQLYAEAAGIELGKVIHIEDVNPRTMSYGGHGEDLSVSNLEEDAEPSKAGPGAITIAAAVQATFAIL